MKTSLSIVKTAIARSPQTEAARDFADHDVMILAHENHELNMFGFTNGSIEGAHTKVEYMLDENCGWMCCFPLHKTDDEISKYLTAHIGLGFHVFEEDSPTVEASAVRPTSMIRVSMMSGHITCDHYPRKCTERTAPSFEVTGIVKASDAGRWFKSHYPTFEKAMLHHAEFHMENGR